MGMVREWEVLKKHKPYRIRILSPTSPVCFLLGRGPAAVGGGIAGSRCRQHRLHPVLAHGILLPRGSRPAWVDTHLRSEPGAVASDEVGRLVGRDPIPHPAVVAAPEVLGEPFADWQAVVGHLEGILRVRN